MDHEASVRPESVDCTSTSIKHHSASYATRLSTDSPAQLLQPAGFSLSSIVTIQLLLYNQANWLVCTATSVLAHVTWIDSTVDLWLYYINDASFPARGSLCLFMCLCSSSCFFKIFLAPSSASSDLKRSRHRFQIVNAISVLEL